MLFYAMFKEAIADDTGLANTILHIHAGMLILMAARIATRRSLGTFVPFTAVFVLELANEIIDRVNHGSWRWDDTASDVVNTLFWPFLLSLAIRLRPMTPTVPATAP
ncbi:hypothetical protein [Sphingomonas sp.]|uniref:hypothetical protein n=1 Tax=Sphingomonas sp. TaxID=28214 RepID=UPI002EDB8E9D